MDGDGGVNRAADIDFAQTATLSAMQAASLSATSAIDSAVLRDFGDGPVFQAKGKGKEETQMESLSSMFGGMQSEGGRTLQDSDEFRPNESAGETVV